MRDFPLCKVTAIGDFLLEKKGFLFSFFSFFFFLFSFLCEKARLFTRFNWVGPRFSRVVKGRAHRVCLPMGFLGSVWECVFKKIICVFKLNRNFGVFGIAILKTQILKSWKNLRFQ
jgi:hypothetical protein